MRLRSRREEFMGDEASLESCDLWLRMNVEHDAMTLRNDLETGMVRVLYFVRVFSCVLVVPGRWLGTCSARTADGGRTTAFFSPFSFSAFSTIRALEINEKFVISCFCPFSYISISSGLISVTTFPFRSVTLTSTWMSAVVIFTTSSRRPVEVSRQAAASARIRCHSGIVR